MIHGITILYQRGTQFCLDLLSLQEMKFLILNEEAPQAWCRWLGNTLMMEGGELMAKQCVTYTFENPNRDESFERVLQQILIDKLAAQERERSAAA